jgi:hypothetical protein
VGYFFLEWRNTGHSMYVVTLVIYLAHVSLESVIHDRGPRTFLSQRPAGLCKVLYGYVVGLLYSTRFHFFLEKIISWWDSILFFRFYLRMQRRYHQTGLSLCFKECRILRCRIYIPVSKGSRGNNKKKNAVYGKTFNV